jgi:hypothetical protein
LLVYGALQFEEETRTSEFFTQHPPILHMALCERVFISGALNVMFMSVNQRFATPESELLNDDLTFMLSANFLSDHFYRHFLAKQGHRVHGMPGVILSKSENKP